MGDAALAVAAGIGYASAGTVEMLLADDGEFFFLEMNTRLQVEHPVTEAVTGRDLVADQLRIAAGATLADLGLSGAPPIRGHAIEARVYAEDPESGFLPATGSSSCLSWPDGVRVDTGIAEGDRVSDRFDPMLAKVIAHGPTREEALRRLRTALDETRHPRGPHQPPIPAMAARAAARCATGRCGPTRSSESSSPVRRPSRKRTGRRPRSRRLLA